MAQLSYRRHRFPPEIIQHAIWLYLRFSLSYRDVEELLLGREGEGTRDYRHLTNTVPASSGKAASSFTP